MHKHPEVGEGMLSSKRGQVWLKLKEQEDQG